MTKTITIEVPRRGVGSDLTEALARHGLNAEFADDGESLALHVSFADNEHDRLVAQAISAVEDYLSEKMLPLIVQRSDDGVIVRPPSD